MRNRSDVLSALRRVPTAVVVGAVVGLAALALVLAVGGRGDGMTNLDFVLADLEERARENPQDVDARVSIASVYLERGLTDDAIKQFEQALVLEPENQLALIGLGQALLIDGDTAAAEEVLRAVAEMNKDNEFRYTIDQLNVVYYELASIALQRDDFDDARLKITEALKVNRADADAWRLLGQIEERAGSLDAAEQAYRSAVRFVPDYDDVCRELERVYEALGAEGLRLYAAGMLELIDEDAERAVRTLERAIEVGPVLGESYEALGMAYEEAGRPEDALQAYRRALSLNADMFLAALAVQRLEAQ